MKLVRGYLLLLQLFHLILFSNCVNTSIIINTLYRTLIDDSKYSPDIRPCVDCVTPLYIDIAFHLTALNKIDEIEGELNTVGFLKVVWLDERLTWNPLLTGVTSIMFHPRKIWIPPIILGNPSKEVSRLNADQALARVLYNGTVIWFPGDVFRSRCEFDVYNYPFDKQRCWIAFTPWAYTANEISLFSSQKQIQKPFFNENGGWKLGSSSVSAYATDNISLIQFDIHFIRRSEFFVVNIIVPISFLSFLNCLAFAIPAQSGERVSYSVTILLSFAVFMTLVSDNIPKTSAPMSLLCYYLSSLFSGSVLIMISVMINIRVFFIDPSTKVPSAYVRLSKILRCCPQKKQQNSRTTGHDIAFKNHPDVYMCTGDSTRTTVADATVTWRDVATGLDRLGFFIFLMYFICITSVMVLYTLSSRF